MPQEYTLAVSGSRAVKDEKEVRRLLSDYEKRHGRPKCVITGGAEGVDTFAEAWAREQGIAVQTIRPDYTKYAPKIAPLIRNGVIIQNADRLLAIVHTKLPSLGTKNTIGHAYRQEKPHEVYVSE